MSVVALKKEKTDLVFCQSKLGKTKIGRCWQVKERRQFHGVLLSSNES